MDKIELRKGDSPTLTYVRVGRLNFAFSYETIVAFATPEDGWVISENVWSQTTGKHLNEIPGGRDKSRRVPHAEFTRKLEAVMDRLPIKVPADV